MLLHIENIVQFDAKGLRHSYEQNQDKTFLARLIVADGTKNQVSLDNCESSHMVIMEGWTNKKEIRTYK